MMFRFLPFALLAAFAGMLLGACSPQNGAPTASPASQQSSTDAAAQRNLETYRQLLRIHNDAMVVTMGHDILEKYPDSAAAKEVQKTLSAVEKRFKAESETQRLDRLWLYQVSPMEGGTQSTATIENSKPARGDKVRLILRRHSEWGLNAFFYGGGHGFVCKGNCRLPMTVDGKKHKLKVYAPKTGEPALMISDSKGFIAMMKEAHTISVAVTPVDSGQKETLVYEVGGFEPGKWKEVGKAKNGKSKK